MPSPDAVPPATAIDLVPATPVDRSTVAAILADARHRLAAAGIAQWTRPFTDEWISARIEANEFWLARVDGEPVAAVRLLWADPAFWGERERGDAAYVHTLAVGGGWTGRGVGLAVLRWAEAHARAHGRRVLRLDCAAANPRLAGYYERAGFVAAGAVTVGGAPMLLFERNLGG